MPPTIMHELAKFFRKNKRAGDVTVSDPLSSITFANWPSIVQVTMAFDQFFDMITQMSDMSFWM
jgi:hypothetical protein